MNTEQPATVEPKSEPEQILQADTGTAGRQADGYRPANRGGRGSFQRRLDELWTIEELDRLAGLPRQRTAENEAQPVAALAKVWDAQGMSGLPTVVSRRDRRALRARGHTEIYRGIGGRRAGEFAEQFRTGKKPYVGYSGYRGGGGTNFTSDPTGGRMGARFYASGRGGVLMAAYLRRDAVVMPVERAHVLCDKDRARALTLKRPELAELLTDDLGIWAALRGIDALVEPRGAYFDALYLVQNRTALFIEEEAPPSAARRVIDALLGWLSRWRADLLTTVSGGRLAAGH